MFVPAEMAEVDIFVLEEDVEAVAQAIARAGAMHLLDLHSLGQWALDTGTEWPGRVAAYAAQERRILELLTLLDIEHTMQPCQGRLNPAEDLHTVEQELQEIEQQAHRLRDEQAEIERQVERWELTAKSMEMLAPLSVSVSDLRDMEHLHVVAGTMPSENLARLETSLFRIPFTIIPVHRYSNRVLIFAFCADEDAAILDRALESAFLDRLEIPKDLQGTPQEALANVQERIREARQRLDEIREQRRAFVAEVEGHLQMMLTRVRDDRAIAEAMAHFGHRGRVYLIAGWVPRDKVEALRTAVESAAQGRITFDVNAADAPGANAVIPTLLRHGKLLQPIESLVTTYGTPGYKELDPTLLVAITFVVMFGAMFGDLGQGLALMVVGALAALHIVPALAPMGALGTILVACGASSAVFGLLYGSVFGFEGVIPSLWLHPMDNMLELLGAAIVFGVLVLNIGFGLRLATAVRQHAIREAIFDRNGIVGFLLYWSLLGLVIYALLIGSVPGWLPLVIVVLMLALLFAEPLNNLVSGKRPLMRDGLLTGGIQAFFELFEALLGYVSNTLSYVRLGAFAVAHVGITMVVMLLADMVSGGVLGDMARIVILILGNIFVIGFEGLIVGIQTLRLEYYEFFGRFYNGQGVPFKPLVLPDRECEPAKAT